MAKEKQVTVGEFFQTLGVDPKSFVVVNLATTGVGNSALVLEIAAGAPDGKVSNNYIVGADPKPNYEFTLIEYEDYVKGAVAAKDAYAALEDMIAKLRPEYFVMNTWGWNEKLLATGKIRLPWCPKNTLAGTRTLCLMDYDATRRMGDTLSGYERFDVMCADFAERTKPGRQCPRRKLEELLESRGIKVPEAGTMACRKTRAMVGLMGALLKEPAFEFELK